MQFKNAPSQVACVVALLIASASLLACSSSPSSIVSSPTLAVADNGNSRVLIYSAQFGNTQNAVAAIGQTDFIYGHANGGTEVPSASTFNGPSSVARDSAGNLYVADSGNSRVLIFRPPFGTGMNASVVIGQPDFTSSNNLGGSDSTAASLLSPYAVAIDHNGNLWVADVSNARVLEYTPPFSNGMAATLAIGQPTTAASTVCYETAPTANNLCYPLGIAFDPSGNLWVSDSDANRVLEYTPPFSTGMAASLELGQPATAPFTSGSAIPAAPGTPSAATLAAPSELAFDRSGNLWVTDFGFNRVLEFAPPFSNGMAATSVLGQADFTHGDANQGHPDPAADTLSGPGGLAFDSRGNLNVADSLNSRILVFAPPLSKGMAASALIGQKNFDLGRENRGANGPNEQTMWHPFSLSPF